ncbi:MAG: cupin domain-containing protein [Nitrospinota bacterium]|jgi:quercetin dioxygenase-like cupin family protein|nr:hypothetical protein [Nitrospinota bacterium]MDP6366271.1 cupin domain-containing protein [Nitrospinota bacterium]MDP7167335.1 cupin domain-containing protein [Nitrospinota bacterium]MDP7371068.1 cupin domain-containing protein [Nitrospinota bacterium]MDP7504078.1 cupin domain-containing protein [Nitrospinota bacterium]
MSASADRKACVIRPDELPDDEIDGGATHKTIVTRSANETDITIYRSRITPGKSHDWHHHEVDEVIFCVGGEGRYELEDGELRFKAGEFIFMPKGTEHRSSSTTDAPVELVAIFQPSLE